MLITDEQLKHNLLEKKLLNLESFNKAFDIAKRTGRSLETVLVEEGMIDDRAMGMLLAEELKVPFVDLSGVSVTEANFHTIPERVARKQRVIVFERDNTTVKVAMVNPTRDDIVRQLSKKTGLKVEIYLATKHDVERTLKLFKRDLQRAVDLLLKEDSGKIRRTDTDDPPVVKVVELLLTSAYDEQASDVHIEPQESEAIVRFRIDGILQEVVRMTKLLHERIITRIKVISNLRTDEHMAAQDGKMKMLIEDERVDIRVSIVPIVDGEKAVLRLLAAKSRHFTLTDLGMRDADLAKVKHAYTKSYGMILSTGPTGSGKTTSIYSVLRILSSPEKNITSVEDPVEYRIPGANQIQVNAKTSLTFANGLRSILRQDPNIIFVGEIRDSETAGIAVNAALTGHLVLSTLHTNDAATALPRLIDMKVEPFLVASTVTIIIAQRLVRKICQGCKHETLIERNELEKLFGVDLIREVFGDKTVSYKGAGCGLCRGSGYSGRIGLFEVLEITPSIHKLIVEKADADAIVIQAQKDGMTPMVKDGLLKVLEGQTTSDELLRVTKIEVI